MTVKPVVVDTPQSFIKTIKLTEWDNKFLGASMKFHETTYILRSVKMSHEAQTVEEYWSKK